MYWIIAIDSYGYKIDKIFKKKKRKNRKESESWPFFSVFLVNNENEIHRRR